MTRPRLTVRVLAGLEVFYRTSAVFHGPDAWAKLCYDDRVAATTAQFWLLQFRKWHNAQLAARRRPTPSTLYPPPITS